MFSDSQPISIIITLNKPCGFLLLVILKNINEINTQLLGTVKTLWNLFCQLFSQESQANFNLIKG